MFLFFFSRPSVSCNVSEPPKGAAVTNDMKLMRRLNLNYNIITIIPFNNLMHMHLTLAHGNGGLDQVQSIQQ